MFFANIFTQEHRCIFYRRCLSSVSNPFTLHRHHDRISFLVTQATGQQGQAVVRRLLAAGAKVNAVVRDVQKVLTILQEPGVILFEGESKNLEDIQRVALG